MNGGYLWLQIIESSTKKCFLQTYLIYLYSLSLTGADPDYCNVSKRCSWNIYLHKDSGLLISADDSIG